MKQILIDNALESWNSAILYANDIMKGMATLKYRKNFVASLHNATELFINNLCLILEIIVCVKNFQHEKIQIACY